MTTTFIINNLKYIAISVIRRFLIYPIKIKMNNRKSEKDIIYFFHHIPKCGGKSLREILKHWFIIIKEPTFYPYRRYFPKYNLNRISGNFCITGHFNIRGIPLALHYPEVFNSNRYRVISFLRDPLDRCISGYFFALKKGEKIDSITERLVGCTNCYAVLFNCNEDNYKEVLDKYFFIGIMEEYSASIKLLFRLLGIDSIPDIPIKNKTARDSRINKITDEIISEFKRENYLDYLIYDYCYEKFSDLKEKYLLKN